MRCVRCRRDVGWNDEHCPACGASVRGPYYVGLAVVAAVILAALFILPVLT